MCAPYLYIGGQCQCQWVHLCLCVVQKSSRLNGPNTRADRYKSHPMLSLGASPILSFSNIRPTLPNTGPHIGTIPGLTPSVSFYLLNSSAPPYPPRISNEYSFHLTPNPPPLTTDHSRLRSPSLINVCMAFL